MHDPRFLLQDGRIHTHMAEAYRSALVSLKDRRQSHVCNLEVPLESLTGDGHWYCLGCLYEEAWWDGHTTGMRDGMEMRDRDADGGR